MFGGQQNRPGGFGTSNTTGGSLFGSSTTTPSTGFGAGATTAGGFGTGGGFGASNTTNTGGGLFGANKTGGFGATNNTTTGGFGSGATGGFGAGAGTASTGFGAGGTAFQGALPTCEGTSGTPFNPFTEKDTNTSATNHYQSISFMQPYSKWSFEELRLADYQKGIRHGNGSGQAGGFGNAAFGGNTGGGFGTNTSTGFGGSTSTPFGGGTSTASTGFGGGTQTAGGFGSTPANNSNPLFGGAKPAGTTSLFGASGSNTNNTTGGSLFGSNTGSTGGFGANNNAAGANTGGAFGNTGSSLFGGNTTQQAKPFGATGTATGSAFGGFGGSQPATSSTPFGSTPATSTPFGGQQNQAGAGGAFGGFGTQNQAQNQAKPGGLFGGSTGGGFGTNNTQPQTGGGLFGSGQSQAPGTGGGLFGGAQNQPQQQTGGGLFGGGGQTQAPGTGGGLFGGSANQTQQKPGGLFGGSTGTTGSAFGGGFGSTQNQPQQQAGGLFGSSANNQQKPGGLFGSTGTGGGGLFGSTQGAAAPGGGSSLFGGGQSQQQQPAGNSLFGGSQPQQQSQPVPGSLNASLLEGNPYGSQSIFSGLPTPSAPSPGPLATPLSSSMKQKQRTPLPVYKITPTAANRLITPPKRQGYGFSYSTYGSPSSTTSTPSGLSNSLLGSGSLRGSVNGSFGRSFSKSYSTSNLRKTFDPDSDSILAPGAMQNGSGRSNGGSLKRLTIDRSLRNDLFSRPASTSPATITNGDDSAHIKKKVSFDSAPAAPTISGGEIIRVESKSPDPTPEELGFLRSTRKSGSLNGIDGVASRSEMESVGRDLAVVPENGVPSPTSSSLTHVPVTPGEDPKPGDYWMKPSLDELSKMTRDQLKRVVDFTVGRQNCGQVTFNGAVDLTTVDIDNIFDEIVDIGLRRITVYPEESVKPPMGKGLNVPSTLRIQNSWPRGRNQTGPITSGPLYEKHIQRLQKVTDTKFISYERETGTWVFEVPHFTTYGLDYDSDEEGENLDQSTLGAGPDDTRTPKAQADHPASFEQSATFSIDESFVGSMIGVEDDTFDFKKRKFVPGSFGQAIEAEDEEMDSEGETESFLEEGSTGSATEHDDNVTESQRSGDSVVESDEDEDMDMAGSFPNLHHTVEREDSQSIGSDIDATMPISRPFGTPGKPRLNLSGDWTEQLQRTISPRKQNRDRLREIQANAFTDRPLLNDGSPEEKSTRSPKKFSTSIDLMNSLFQQPRKQNAPSPLKATKSQPKGFEVRTPFMLST
jgi:nuclear pore complex protein Nup98-Nup96